jgi:hypothetical protein
MDLTENRNGSVVTLGASGRIDHQTADAFQQALDPYLGGLQGRRRQTCAGLFRRKLCVQCWASGVVDGIQENKGAEGADLCCGHAANCRGGLSDQPV